jgi:uncharacterized protein (TIGR02996 family)
MIDREVFLQALADNPDDVDVRLVFADWLDDHGEHEEADRQRKWPAAKQWFVRLCQENNPPPDYEEPRAFTYEEVIEMGRHAIHRVLSTCEYGIPLETLEQMLCDGWETLENAKMIAPADRWSFNFYFGNNEDMLEAIATNAREYWTNWSIITGIPLPPGVEAKSRFSCAC